MQRTFPVTLRNVLLVLEILLMLVPASPVVGYEFRGFLGFAPGTFLSLAQRQIAQKVYEYWIDGLCTRELY